MTEDFDFHMGRRADRTYVSKSFVEQDSPRTKRILYKVFDGEQDEFGKVLDEIVVKERRHSGRVEIRAYFYEDNRQIERITLVKFYNGEPSRQVQYTLRGEELRQFSALLHAVRAMPFDAETGERFDDEVLSGAANLMSDAGMRRFLRERPELVIEVAKNDLTQQDIVGLAYRKQQLEVFESLLSDQAFFSGKMQEWEKHRPEDVWQHFFENNTWIFGYGLQQGQRTLTSLSGEDFEEKSIAPTATAAFHGNTFAAGVLFEERECEPVEPGEVLSDVFVPDS